MYSRSRTRGHGKPEGGTACVRRFQTSHRLLSHALSSEGFRERSVEICHGKGVDPVSTGEAATSISDPQDHRVPCSREYRERREMENYTEPRAVATGAETQLTKTTHEVEC